ncbi:molybdopterin dinucleotide binding domain-containing protein [Mycobacterium colombiense]|uniref:molybdopterin dinucleotide binding domain-containing protein n=1 Tax=Mycobacterium colombiense TaxID=339268 RepID=UPI0009C1710F|nr:molybdopterin dinucleotide binding domain-containing protein [Mycobacterium colombiense]
MNSWLNDTPSAVRRSTTNTLLLHPDDATPLGIQTGDTVRVSSQVDSLDCVAEVSEVPMAGVAVLDHGWGSGVLDPQNRQPSEIRGSNRNALVSDQEVDVLSGTPAFGITRVRVERLA